ncbi:MAG: hypothetical protein HFJ34_08065 [Clostridia bacterium]|nr:hypothetical protein [Clostridia bacterium]
MFRDKLKQLTKGNLEKGEGNNKKKIENLVFFVVLLIVTIVIINLIWNGNKQVTKQENNTAYKQLASSNQNVTKVENTMVTTNDSLAEQLEVILSKIQGVGEVKVFVNYSESSEVIAMYNETTKTSNTEESDTSGGTRKIQETDSQKDIIYQEESGEKTPITQKIVQPKVEGAIITAKGAGNVETKTNIIQAVEAVTGLATHKIQVFEMK